MQDSATTPDYSTRCASRRRFDPLIGLQRSTTIKVPYRQLLCFAGGNYTVGDSECGNPIPRTESTIHICGLMQRRYHVVDAQWLSWLAYLYSASTRLRPQLRASSRSPSQQRVRQIPSLSASATVTLMPQVSVSITPSSVTLSESQSEQFRPSLPTVPTLRSLGASALREWVRLIHLELI